MRFTRGWLAQAEGSVLVEFGHTRVLVAASVTEGVPRWRKGSGLGWVTSEYAMLPRATNTRNDRESVKGRIGGRTHEISRLIGRSLRAVIDYRALGENTIVLDCDVLQADGGTRTASITGAYVALADAVSWLRDRNLLAGEPLSGSVAAVSVGVVDGTPMLDLCYTEDSAADTDMNIVMSGDGAFIEVQGTAEGAPFDRARAGPAARPRRRGLRPADRAAAGRARDVTWSLPIGVVLATNNAQEAGRAAPDRRRDGARRRGPRAGRRCRRIPSRPRPSGPLRATRCSRPAPALRRPGCRHSPTTPDSRSTCSTDARRTLRPVGRSRRQRRGQQRAAAAPARRRARQQTDCPVRLRHGAGSARRCRTRAARRNVGAGWLSDPPGHNGFGYDPLFVAEGNTVTNGELEPAAKDAISHRGRGGSCDRSCAGCGAAPAGTGRGAEPVKTYLDLLDHVLTSGRAARATGPAPARSAHSDTRCASISAMASRC